MNITIDSRNKMPHLDREEMTASLTFEGPVPSRQDVKKELAKAAKSKEELTIIRQIKPAFGDSNATVTAVVYENEDSMKKIEGKYMIERHAVEEKADEADDKADEKADESDDKAAEKSDEPEESDSEDKSDESDDKADEKAAEADESEEKAAGADESDDESDEKSDEPDESEEKKPEDSEKADSDEKADEDKK